MNQHPKITTAKITYILFQFITFVHILKLESLCKYNLVIFHLLYPKYQCISLSLRQAL